jgi:hypothetical protein
MRTSQILSSFSLLELFILLNMNEEYDFDSETAPVMIQSYMDWEETAAVNAAQKEAKRKTKPHSEEPPPLDVVKKERGS